MIKLSDYLVKKLEKYGVRQVFMVTGGGAMHLDDSFGKSTQIKRIFNHNEQAVAISAEAYARTGQQLAVACVTTGPGGLNCLNGVFGAWTDSAPVLFISGQVKFSTTLASCLQVPLRQLGDQEVNIISVVKPLTKYARMVTDPYELDAVLDEAVYRATSGRPGPVWVDIPLNVQAAPVDPKKMKKFRRPSVQKTSLGKTAARVWHMLERAKRPLLVAGNGIHCAGAQAELRRLLDKTQMPVVTTFNGFDLVPSSDPLFAGRIGTVGQRAGNFALQNADVILFLGTRNNIRQASYNWENFAKNAKKIIVDIDPAELKKPTVRPDVPVCADVKDFLVALLRQKIPFQAPVQWLAFCQRLKAQYPPLREFSIRPTDKVHPYLFATELAAQLPPKAGVALANATAFIAFFQAASIKSGQRVFSNSGDASMGYGLPAAIGMCAARGNQDTVCLEGDGSIMMNLQELQTVKTNRLPLKIFVIKNGEYISIIQTQRNFFNGRLTGCNVQSGVEVPDFVKVAKAFGLPAVRIGKNKDLKAGIRRVLQTPGPVVCELDCTHDYTFAPKLSARKLPDGTMVSPSLEDMFPFLDRKEMEAIQSAAKQIGKNK